jgi:hypothetical protein
MESSSDRGVQKAFVINICFIVNAEKLIIALKLRYRWALFLLPQFLGHIYCQPIFINKKDKVPKEYIKNK